MLFSKEGAYLMHTFGGSLRVLYVKWKIGKDIRKDTILVSKGALSEMVAVDRGSGWYF